MDDKLSTMTADQIIEMAKANGYTTYTTDAGHLRIDGSKMEHGPDTWMNAANVALWVLQGDSEVKARK